MKTVQTNEEVLANAKAFLEYILPTKFYLLVDPRTMTPQQCQTAEANAILFNHWLFKNKNTPEGVDYSVQSIKEAYIALRNAGMITFEVAPPSSTRTTP